MPPDDVDRLYIAMRELRDSVEAYRADLNGRLRSLEAADARRDGEAKATNHLGRIVVGCATMASAVGGIVSLLTDRI
jgi:hypothetical protein